MDASRKGIVYLIGAGPGDPGLLTLRGAAVLARADVVYYDYLVNVALLRHARDDAEKICLGRHGAGKLWSQTEINQQLVAAAQSGRVVARLKGGDPAVFGQLSDELQALSAAAIPFEIVPGVTSASAAACYAGFPLTDRHQASAVALVTGQEGRHKADSALDYAALASFPGALVFYMGVTSAAHWTAALLQAGKPPDTPAAIVRRCTWPNQQVIGCRLDEVAGRLDQSRPDRLRPPAIVVVGEIAQPQAALSWFTQRPLFGQTILTTRASEQNAALVERLNELGAETLSQPAIEIGPPADWAPVDAAIARLSEFDWIVFSSVNGVQSFFRRLFEQADTRRLNAARLAAIGPETAEECWRIARLRVDLTPSEYRAEALASALIAQWGQDDAQQNPEADPLSRRPRVLLIRASRGREILAEQLAQAGAAIEQIVVYSSADVAAPSPEIRERLESGVIDWMTVTSSAIARSLAKMFGESLRRTRLASISPITSQTLQELGYPPAIEAETYSMEGLVAAIRSAVSP